jgi:hypothetical protein
MCLGWSWFAVEYNPSKDRRVIEGSREENFRIVMEYCGNEYALWGDVKSSGRFKKTSRSEEAEDEGSSIGNQSKSGCWDYILQLRTSELQRRKIETLWGNRDAPKHS